MGFRFEIVAGSGTPIYRQIVEGVRRAVIARALEPGEALPSVRALAEQVLVNPNTVARAYNELAGEGWIQSQPGRGMFVADRIPTASRSARGRRLRAAAEALVDEALAAGVGFADLRAVVHDAVDAAIKRAPRPTGSKETGV